MLELEIFDDTGNTIEGPTQYTTDPHNPSVPTIVVDRAIISTADIPAQVNIFGNPPNLVDAFDGKSLTVLTMSAPLPPKIKTSGYFIDTTVALSDATGTDIILQSRRPSSKDRTIMYAASISVHDLQSAQSTINPEIVIITPDHKGTLRRGVLRVK